MENTIVNNNEKRLILLLCRLTFSEQEKNEIKELVSQKINWMKVFEYTIPNKITTLCGFPSFSKSRISDIMVCFSDIFLNT